MPLPIPAHRPWCSTGLSRCRTTAWRRRIARWSPASTMWPCCRRSSPTSEWWCGNCAPARAGRARGGSGLG